MKDVIHGDVKINLCVSLYCMEAVRARMLTKDKMLGDISVYMHNNPLITIKNLLIYCCCNKLDGQ